MTDRPVSLTEPPTGYTDWLADLKTRIHRAQQRATLAVNRELVLLYWQIGRDILGTSDARRLGRQGNRTARTGSAHRLPGHEGLFALQPDVYASLCRGLAGC